MIAFGIGVAVGAALVYWRDALAYAVRGLAARLWGKVAGK